MSLTVLCDFDGTALNIDTCEFILDKFAKVEWRIFDEQLERGEITLEECLQKQFSTVRVPRTLILKEVERVASFRLNFDKLVEYCKTHKIPLILVSAGLDFVIKHFLELKSWHRLVEVYAPKARCTANGIKLTFPALLDKASLSFKDDLVTYYKNQGNRVIYVGNGMADYSAARNAHFSFAIECSKLAQLLKKEGIPHKEIGNFQEVVEAIKVLTSLRE